ncbi:c-type cytochrome [Caulobacter vibrioides]|uniref:Cytochrome c family protein n=2 Tax=Caulobacter vibrioides TaxID=155892 RepID=Q9A4N8_CAUVC|nr:cytochrome c [Caulobacter vibrioides]YP_002518255.1 cbb3-type cytochrome C oxidase, subunit III [Caulobacter vibrioides NA1000]AAK24756.1 cytochrome c family protein [Caulobacter vibrioides CB15]ACL96347.1 cbb3-type cytochrome C oxidase, subunit III [Caulobacter vibrioides NA1000]ATC29628.1 cytochrome C [Caulobacter vibrioides]QXZ51148.1 cytochrome c [Caulobacter vibrioides]
MRMFLLLAATLVAAPAFAQDSAGGVVRVEKPVTGEQVYGAVCQACHMADAKGAVGAGTIPGLASNPKLAGAAYPIMVVARGQGAMPGFAGTLSNAQMAEAVTYVRTHFGNSYAKPVTEADVAKFAKPPSAGGH